MQHYGRLGTSLRSSSARGLASECHFPSAPGTEATSEDLSTDATERKAPGAPAGQTEPWWGWGLLFSPGIQSYLE